VEAVMEGILKPYFSIAQTFGLLMALQVSEAAGFWIGLAFMVAWLTATLVLEKHFGVQEPRP
jgi:hypothetical protein